MARQWAFVLAVAWLSAVASASPGMRTPAVAALNHTATAGLPAFASLFTDIKGAPVHGYGLQDSEGMQMGCLHIVQSVPGPASGHPYIGLYHSQVGSEFQVRVATSTDLTSWKFVRTLLPNADMPFPFTVSPNGWIVVAHEQWMNAGSQLPSRLGFKLYYNASFLLKGQHFNSFVAPLTVGSNSKLEGTPNIYSASLVMRRGLYMVDMKVGFHFNDDQGIDQVAEGALTSFGPTVVTPAWSSALDSAYDEVFIKAGAIGNIGQRDSGVIDNTPFILQEGNIGHMPPTIWADWRVWMYVLGPGEPLPPTGAGTAYKLQPTTNGGSTAFGNPAFAMIPCPNGVGGGPSSTCVFGSYFIFSQGAAPGEAGVCVFVHELP